MEDSSDKLSPILENYLEIIFYEEFESGVARTGTIAEKANVSSSTVTSALKSLQKMGYVIYQPYKFIKLTEKGMKLARRIVHKHSVLKEFFSTVLNMSEEKANEVACELEHSIDEETFDKLGKFTLYAINTPALIENWEEKSSGKFSVKSKSVKK